MAGSPQTGCTLFPIFCRYKRRYSTCPGVEGFLMSVRFYGRSFWPRVAACTLLTDPVLLPFRHSAQSTLPTGSPSARCLPQALCYLSCRPLLILWGEQQSVTVLLLLTECGGCVWKDKCRKEHSCGTDFGKLHWRKKRSRLRSSQSQPVWGDAEAGSPQMPERRARSRCDGQLSWTEAPSL